MFNDDVLNWIALILCFFGLCGGWFNNGCGCNDRNNGCGCGDRNNGCGCSNR